MGTREPCETVGGMLDTCEKEAVALAAFEPTWVRWWVYDSALHPVSYKDLIPLVKRNQHLIGDNTKISRTAIQATENQSPRLAEEAENKSENAHEMRGMKNSEQ